MNSHAIKLNGKFQVDHAPEIDKSYTFKLVGGVNSIAKHSQENGEYEFVYNVKPEFGEILTDGQTIKMRKKGSQSQILRADILSQDLDYELTMSKIINNLETVLYAIKDL